MVEGILMFTIEYIKQNSGVWLLEDYTRATVIVKFVEFEEEHKHTATLNESTYANDIINALSAGEAGTVKSFAEYQAEKLQEIESYRTKVSNKILELKPDAVLPTDADFNGDGESTLTELQTLLDRLETKATEAAFDAKYGI